MSEVLLYTSTSETFVDQQGHDAPHAMHVPLQGYLAYTKTHPPRTLPRAYA